MLSRIYNILATILGESRQGYYDSGTVQYQFNCHGACMDENGGVEDDKYNLECNLSIGVFHCWKCGEKGNLSTLIKRYGGNSLCKEYQDAIKELKECKYLDPDMFQDNIALQTLDNVQIRLPKTFMKIDLSHHKGTILGNYLEKRKITQQLIDKYNIGYTSSGINEEAALRNRIIVPSYDSTGNLNYWVGRDFTENAKRFKYWNSKMDKKSIIFQESHIEWNADIYLCEGVLDSLYYENSIALMGKVLTKDSEIYRKLQQKANANVIICLDADTEIDETMKIYKLLNQDRLYGRIRYIRLDKYKDFGEVFEANGVSGMIDLFKKQSNFKETDLI